MILPISTSRSLNPIAKAPARPCSCRGGMLIEALIGLLIMGIVGAGMVHVSARVAVSQQHMQIQDVAVREMRNLLLRHGSGTLDLCSGTAPTLTLPSVADPVDVAVQGCGLVDAQITLNGSAATVPDMRRPLVLTIDAQPVGLIRVGGQG